MLIDKIQDLHFYWVQKAGITIQKDGGHIMFKGKQQYHTFPSICLCYGRIGLKKDRTGLGTTFIR